MQLFLHAEKKRAEKKECLKVCDGRNTVKCGYQWQFATTETIDVINVFYVFYSGHVFYVFNVFIYLFSTFILQKVVKCKV